MPLRRYIAFATVYTLLFICLPLPAFAGKVELARAKQAAQNWLQNSAQDKRLVGKKTYQIIGQEPIVVNKKTVGYNFILSPRGHIIVPARDELPVVKLYSFTSTLRIAQGSDAAKWISEELFGVEDTIDRHAVDMAGVNQGNTHNGRLWARFGKDPSTFAQESAALPGSQTETLSLGPLLSTTWNQGDPYNLNTPLWYNGQKTVTGCVATAAAQIMKFWNYPTTGQNSKSYTWNNGSTNQTLSANFASSTYDWANMSNSYGGASTTVQRQVVAKLMSDVGIAFEMVYGISSSGGSAANTMAGTTVYPTFFKYKNTIQAVYRTSYASDSAWMQVFKNEVQNGRPSQFRLRDPSAGGHSVVVDGFRDSPSEQIHLNMGWSGGYDGWYVSNNIVTGAYSWSDVSYQAAVIGIEPAAGQCNPPAGITVPASSSGSHTVSWGASAMPGVTYLLEESESPDFSLVTTAYSGSALSAVITKASDGIYYYRVKARMSEYIDSAYATSATGCVVDVPGANTINSTDVPKSIADSGTVTSNLTLPSGLCDVVTDVNVSLNITHTWVGDLSVSLTHNSSGRTVQLYNIDCGEDDNLVAVFDDEAPNAASCPPNGTYQPAMPLTALDGINATGTWTLTVADNAAGDSGTLNSWGITLACASLPRQLSLTINGNGSVNSSPGGIACTTGNKGNCSAQFADWVPVTLTATGVSSPTLLSHFGNWSGACDSTLGAACSVTMNADKGISSTFVTNQPVYIYGGSHYGSLQAAYDAVGTSGIVIEAQAVALPALDFTLDKGKTVTLKGGYNSIYLSNSGGYTTMDGILTLGSGSLTVENLIIK
jgi:subtilisin-like proprotein convertase family protein